MKALISNLVAPLATRVGTLFAGSALTLGATVEQADDIKFGIMAVVLVGFDLAIRKMVPKG